MSFSPENPAVKAAVVIVVLMVVASAAYSFILAPALATHITVSTTVTQIATERTVTIYNLTESACARVITINGISQPRSLPFGHYVVTLLNNQTAIWCMH